jgi:hypothetical protein
MKSDILLLKVSWFFLTQIFIGCDNAKQDQPAKQFVDISARNIEVKKKIEEINQSLSKAVIANDYETQLKYFSEDAVIEPPPGPTVKGKSEIRKGFEKNRLENVTFHSHSATTQDLWVCGDRVHEKGKWGWLRVQINQKLQ